VARRANVLNATKQAIGVTLVLVKARLHGLPQTRLGQSEVEGVVVLASEAPEGEGGRQNEEGKRSRHLVLLMGFELYSM